MWWRVVDMQRCFFVNFGSEIRDFHDLQRHLSCRSSFTGSLQRISEITSNERVGSGGDVRVSVEVFNCCLLLVAVSGREEAISVRSSAIKRT